MAKFQVTREGANIIYHELLKRLHLQLGDIIELATPFTSVPGEVFYRVSVNPVKPRDPGFCLVPVADYDPQHPVYFGLMTLVASEIPYEVCSQTSDAYEESVNNILSYTKRYNKEHSSLS